MIDGASVFSWWDCRLCVYVCVFVCVCAVYIRQRWLELFAAVLINCHSTVPRSRPTSVTYFTFFSSVSLFLCAHVTKCNRIARLAFFSLNGSSESEKEKEKDGRGFFAERASFFYRNSFVNVLSDVMRIYRFKNDEKVEPLTIRLLSFVKV